MSLRKKRIALIRLAFVPVVLIALFVRPSWSINSVTAFCVEMAGYLFLLAGVIVRLWSILYIGGRKSRELVVEGPYSICRNPLYIGTLFIAIGAALLFKNPLMLAAVLLIMVPAHLVTTRLEEKHLLTIFGDTFRQYLQSVPRYWPRLSAYRSSESIEVPVRSLRRIAVDMSAVLMLPPFAYSVAFLQDHSILPVLLRFP